MLCVLSRAWSNVHVWCQALIEIRCKSTNPLSIGSGDRAYKLVSGLLFTNGRLKTVESEDWCLQVFVTMANNRSKWNPRILLLSLTYLCSCLCSSRIVPSCDELRLPHPCGRRWLRRCTWEPATRDLFFALAVGCKGSIEKRLLFRQPNILFTAISAPLKGSTQLSGPAPLDEYL